MNQSYAKKKDKSLGGYTKNSPYRLLSMGESIYNLSFVTQLTTDGMDRLEEETDFAVDEEARPT